MYGRRFVRMHVKTKNIAFLGLLMAICVILVVLSGVFEINTFMLLALASFGTGIAIYEVGIRGGTAFFVGSVILSFFVAPNKLYVGTYAGISFYLVAIEFVWNKLFKAEYSHKNIAILTVFKVVLFNVMYIPIIILVPDLLSGIEITTPIFIALLVFGQAILIVYDKAYKYFMNRYWGQIRRAIHL